MFNSGLGFPRLFVRNTERILLTAFLILILFSELCGQQATGLHDENYAGIHGIMKNPAFAHHGLLDWDINLGTAHLFLDNDYAFVRNTNLFHLLANRNSVQVVDIESDEPLAPGILLLDFDEDSKQKYLTGLADVTGPSFFFTRGRWATGLFTRVRAEFSALEIPGQLGYYSFQNTPINSPFVVTQVLGAGMMWGEAGINLARSFMEDESLSIGISLKYLIGYEGIYGATDGPLALNRPGNQEVTLIETQGTLGLTSGIADHHNFRFSTRGKGIGIDLGISKIVDQFRISISILDIGSVSFAGDAELHRLNVSDSLVVAIPNITSQNNLDGVISEINALLVDSTLVGNSFSIGLPARVRLNFDYWITGPWYINASLIQRLTENRNALKKDNNLAITPRFERRWLSVSAPVIMRNYKSVRIGLSARLGLLTLGTDDLFSLVGKSNFNGSSLYIALKINPFKTTGRVAVHNRAVGCPGFSN